MDVSDGARMRSRKLWRARLLVVAAGILTLTVVDHYVFHHSVVMSIYLGVICLVPVPLAHYWVEAEQRRQARVRQDPASVNGQDASEG